MQLNEDQVVTKPHSQKRKPGWIRRKKPVVFVACSSLMNYLKIRKDLKRNGYIVLGFDYSNLNNPSNVLLSLIDLRNCDRVVYVSDYSIMVAQDCALGIALNYGKIIYVVNGDIETDPVFSLPNVEHFKNWNQLRDLKFTKSSKLLKKQIAALQGWLGRMKSKPYSSYRKHKIDEVTLRLKELRKQYESRFDEREETQVTQ